MGWIGLWLALLVPWLAGALWVRRLWPEAGPGRWALALGYGYWLGIAAATLLLLPLSILGLRPAFWLILGLCLGVAVWAGRDLIRSKQRGAMDLSGLRSLLPRPAPSELTSWRVLLAFALFLWIAWRLAILALHVWYQPLFPWDAWTTWALRARVWSELGQLIPFVAPEVWDVDRSGSYTLEAWRYPPLVSLIALWPTLLLAGWDETAANLPWVGAGLSLALGFYGQLRLWGVDRLLGLVGVWLLISLPLLDTHIALAGYADLWLAGALGLGLIAFLQWVRAADRRQLALCLILAATWPLIKLEGVAWLILLVLGFIVAKLRWGRSQLAIGGLIALGLIALWLIGLRLTTPLGTIELSTQAVELPFIGRFAFGYHPNWWPLVLMLFGLENWHLLGYLLLAGLLLAVYRLLRGDASWLRAAFALVGASLGLLWTLFFLTDAAAWAERGTALGRLLLQFMPLYVFFLLALWLDLQGGRSPASSNTR